MTIRMATAAAAALTALVLSSSAASAATAVDPPTLGIPGTPNCVGQTTAAVAQVAGPHGSSSGSDAPGVGNIAVFTGMSVAEVKATIRAYCAG